MADSECVKRLVLVGVVILLATASAATSAREAEPYPCDSSQPSGPYEQPPPLPAQTYFVMDGELYAIVSSSKSGLIGGWSGSPVQTPQEAFRWARALGYGTRLFSAHEIVGATFADSGSRSSFSFECRASYRACVVVRRGRSPVRLALADIRGGSHTRAFHSQPLQLPSRAVLELRFEHPLTRRAPTLLVDRNGDGTWDRRVVLRAGDGGLIP